MTNQTVVLADGYRGHTATFNAAPIEPDGPLVKLQVAGKVHLTGWKLASDVEASLQHQTA